MVLAIECVIACIVYGFIIVGATIKNKEAWLEEYAPEVQKRYLEKNCIYHSAVKEVKRGNALVKKMIGSVFFVIILIVCVSIAGADDFFKGFCYSYIIWLVVNIFDVVVLDLGIFTYWKKVRLPGTEDMDREYRSNAGKSIRDGIAGIMIGIPVALVCGIMVQLIDSL